MRMTALTKSLVSNITCYSNGYEEIIGEKLLDLSMTKPLRFLSVQVIRLCVGILLGRCTDSFLARHK